MIKIKNQRNVLIVSESRAFFDNIKTVLPPDEFDTRYASSCGEARRFIVDRAVDILILNLPLPDEHGLLFAEDYIDSSMGILLICPAELYESIAYDAEEKGIVVLADPCPPAFVYVAAKMMASLVTRLEKMEAKNKTMQEKMADIRIVNKAKWALIEKKNMTEGEAHKYIEKLAMDKRISSREAAEQILEE